MILARVEGSVVATKKHGRMTGSKFLLVRPIVVDSAADKELRAGSNTLVTVDTLGAGEGDLVLVVQGSSARLGVESKDTPVDAVVVGIIDTVEIGKRTLFKAR